MVRRKTTGGSRASSPSGRSKVSSTHTLVPRNKKRARHVRALKEIKYLRKAVHLLIPKAPFARLVREIMLNMFPNLNVERIQASALEALQESTEAYIVQFFEDCLLLSHHAKRTTLQIHDVILMRRLRGRDDIINR